jgi:CIC family chloride channel protein
MRIVATEVTSQPNVTELEISPRLWVIVLITGIGAGLTSGLLMELLRAAQHLSYAYHTGDFQWAILAGPIAGSISVAYVRVIGWAQAHKPQGWQVIFLPILFFTLLGIAAIKFPQLLGNGKNIVQLTFFNRIDTRLLCSLIVLRPLAAAVCLRSGAPGGLFTPTMTLGALLGDAMGQLWNHLAPGNEIASYALIGSGAFLAAATLGPLSSIVFLLELTRHADVLIVPLLIAAVGATVTARAWGVRSIYTARNLPVNYRS